MKNRLFSVFAAFFIFIPICQTNKTNWAVSSVYAAQSDTEPTKEEGGSDKEKTMHGEINEEKEQKHDEGMHGMMMGHHMKGWWIVIGVVMVIMMGAHVAVLF